MATTQDLKPERPSTQALLVALADETQKTVELIKELAGLLGITLRPNGDAALSPRPDEDDRHLLAAVAKQRFFPDH